MSILHLVFQVLFEVILFFFLLRGKVRVLDIGQCQASELYGPVTSSLA